jgi:hypothetical protein
MHSDSKCGLITSSCDYLLDNTKCPEFRRGRFRIPADMAEKEAKELTVEVWSYLAKHPSIRAKCDLPSALYDKVRLLRGECPLCALFDLSAEEDCPACPACPLARAGECCSAEGSAYSDWAARWSPKKSAERIVEIVSAWKPRQRDRGLRLH